MLRDFTVNEALFMACILAISGRYLCAKEGIVLSRTNAAAFFFFPTHKVIWLVHDNMLLSSNNDYVLRHCASVICLSPYFFLYLSTPCLCFDSRVAVIRGRVVLQDGSPLVGVNITFPQHPEYGYTISRQDGR